MERAEDEKKEDKLEGKMTGKTRLNCEWLEEPEEIGSWHVGCVKGNFRNVG